MQFTACFSVWQAIQIKEYLEYTSCVRLTNLEKSGALESRVTISGAAGSTSSDFSELGRCSSQDRGRYRKFCTLCLGLFVWVFLECKISQIFMSAFTMS